MSIARIEELFSEGEAISVKNSRGQMSFWVKKLNAFERDEAIKDARGARAQRMLTFDDDEGEQASIKLQMQEMSKSQLVEDLLHREAASFMLEADAAVRAEKEWQEKLVALDRADLEGSEPSEAQQRTMNKITAEFQSAVLLEQQKRLREKKAEYDAMSVDDLHEAYRAAYREMLGATAFHEEKSTTEIWYALYDVEVELDDNGEPIQDTAKPGARTLKSRDEVNRLPDAVTEAVVRSLSASPNEEQAKN